MKKILSIILIISLFGCNKSSEGAVFVDAFPIIFSVLGLGVAGYFGYKYYKGEKTDTNAFIVAIGIIVAIFGIITGLAG